jgi:hypothetical protein
MKTTKIQIATLATMALFGAAICGCKTVARENVLSTVNTGVGISLSENPQTELYEVKFGFIRSQFYSVPSGKVVQGDKNFLNATNQFSNQAQMTPNVVSGIRVQSDLRHLFLGADIVESFALGSDAVKSRAAVAMYISNAETDQKATNAAAATTLLKH